MISKLTKPFGAILGVVLLTLSVSSQANVIRIDQVNEKANVTCDAGAVVNDCQGVINTPGVLSNQFAEIYAIGNNSEKSETDLLNSLMGAGTVDVDDATRIDTGGADSASFLTSATWFAIKTGNGISFFKNNGGEITLSVLYEKGEFGQGMGISHVTFWGTAREVPEPGTLALLGMGIMGFGLMRRRRAA